MDNTPAGTTCISLTLSLSLPPFPHLSHTHTYTIVYTVLIGVQIVVQTTVHWRRNEDIQADIVLEAKFHVQKNDHDCSLLRYLYTICSNGLERSASSRRKVTMKKLLTTTFLLA